MSKQDPALSRTVLAIILELSRYRPLVTGSGLLLKHLLLLLPKVYHTTVYPLNALPFCSLLHLCFRNHVRSYEILKDSRLHTYMFHKYRTSCLKARKFINTVYLIHYNNLIWKVFSWINGPEKQVRDYTFANIFIQMSLTQQENRANLLRLVCRLPQTRQIWKQIPLITTACVLHMVDMPTFYAQSFEV